MEETTLKEKISIELKKLKALTFKQKLEYIWDYYKPLMVGILAAVLVIALIIQVIQGMRTTTELSVAIINSTADDKSVQSFCEEFEEYADLNGQNQEVIFDAGYQIQPQSSDQSSLTFQTKIIAQISADTLDIMLMTEDVFEEYADNQAFADLQELLSEQLLSDYQEQLMIREEGQDGQQKAYGIDVSKSQKLTGLYTEEPVICAVIANSQNVENVQKFIEYLLI